MRAISLHPPNTGVDVVNLGGEPLSQEQMYVRCNFAVPAVPPDGFEIVLPGKTGRFVTPADLGALDMVERDLVLECAGNGRTLMERVPEGTPWDLDGVSPIRVGGYQLADVLGALSGDIVDVVFTGADSGMVEPDGEVPYQFSISRDLAVSTLPLLVTHIGGQPLDLFHGAPVRLVVPGHYAMMSVKWLTRVEALTTEFAGHFVKKYRYYGDDLESEQAPVGPLAVRSVIVAPADGATVEAGRLELVGSAWGGSHVGRVEVSIDGGITWDDARISHSSDEPWSATRWRAHVDVSPGTLEIMARATEITGDVQPLQPRWNANGYANNVVHRITVHVV